MVGLENTQAVFLRSATQSVLYSLYKDELISTVEWAELVSTSAESLQCKLPFLTHKKSGLPELESWNHPSIPNAARACSVQFKGCVGPFIHYISWH